MPCYSGISWYLHSESISNTRCWNKTAIRLFVLLIFYFETEALNLKSQGYDKVMSEAVDYTHKVFFLYSTEWEPNMEQNKRRKEICSIPCRIALCIMGMAFGVTGFMLFLLKLRNYGAASWSLVSGKLFLIDRYFIIKAQMFRENAINSYFTIFRDFLDKYLFSQFTPNNAFFTFLWG